MVQKRVLNEKKECECFVLNLCRFCCCCCCVLQFHNFTHWLASPEVTLTWLQKNTKYNINAEYKVLPCSEIILNLSRLSTSKVDDFKWLSDSGIADFGNSF